MNMNNEIFEYIYNSDKENIIDYINNGYDVNILNEHNNSPLNVACYMLVPNHEIIDILLANGADHTKKDNFGITPIFRAVLSNSLDMVKIFIKYNVDYNTVDNNGFNLLYVCNQDDIDMFKYLIDLGINYYQTDTLGNPLTEYHSEDSDTEIFLRNLITTDIRNKKINEFLDNNEY